MATGPLGVPRPLVRCNMALIYRVTGIPREDRHIVFNRLETEIRDNIPVRVKDMFIQPGIRRTDANIVMIAVVLDPIGKTSIGLGNLQSDNEWISQAIEEEEKLGRIEYVNVAWGDIEQEIRR